MTDNQQLTICTIQLLSSTIFSKYMTNSSEKKEENNDTGLYNLRKGAVIFGDVYKLLGRLLDQFFLVSEINMLYQTRHN